MSLTKSTARRLSLMAGSSLIAASLSAIATIGIAVAPTAAVAQTCTPAAAPGANPDPDSYTCSGTPHTGGITYTSAGSPLTLTTTTSGMDVGTVGINLTGVGADSITFNSGVEIDGAGIVGALLEMRSGSGTITVNGTGTPGAFLDADQTNAAAMTHGILALSDTGDINISFTREIDAETSAAANAVAGIEARTAGDGSITIHSSSSRSLGRLYGILAEVEDGDLTITANEIGASDTAGIAGIHATTGTGLLTINAAVGAVGAGAYGGPGTGAHIDAGGDVMFTGQAAGGQYGIDLVNVVAGSTSTINLAGIFATTGGLAAIRAQGAGDVVVNLTGVQQELLNFDFTGMAAREMVNVVADAAWRPASGSSTVAPAGNFDITIQPGGALVDGTGASGNDTTVIAFADTTSVIHNQGFVLVGPRSYGSSGSVDGAELRIEGLGEFRHSGLVLLGTESASGGDQTFVANVRTDVTDGWYDDILSLPGATWVGEGGSIFFDVDISRSQTDCVRDPVTRDLGGADCLQLVGGATEGTTYISILEAFPGDRLRPLEEGIVLVEVTGGTSAQGHFVLSPGMDGYSPLFGGSMDRGIYHYVLTYDDSTQQHRLFGFTGSAAYHFPQYATAAHSLWRVSTGTWLDRQADLRGGIEPGVGGGVWLRAGGEIADRDSAVNTERGGQTFTLDNTHQQTSYAVTGGVDLMSASTQDMAWVVGLMAGYNYADIEYDAWESTGQFDGFNAGAYASFLAGGLFVDAALNANRLILKNDVPSLGIFPEGSILDTILVSVGGQVEAGWRLPVAGSMFVEPLASISYVRSKYDDLEVASADPSRPGINVIFDDPTSLRASIGGRAGVDQDFGFLRTQFSVLGRVWNEFEGENTILLENEFFPDEANVPMVDDFTGRFTELGLGASVWSPGGLVSGFVNLGGKFGDDYQAKTGTVGVRVAW